MILTVAVFLDTREKIAVLVSQFFMLWNSHLTPLDLLYSYVDYPLSSVLHCFLERKSEETFKAKAKRGSC